MATEATLGRYGYLAINKNGRRDWASIDVSGIPNVLVLLALIERVAGGRVKVGRPQPATLA